MTDRNDETPRQESTDRPEDAVPREEVAELAYARYLARGQADGMDMDDWLAAEQEVRLRHAGIPAVQQAGDQGAERGADAASGGESATGRGERRRPRARATTPADAANLTERVTM